MSAFDIYLVMQLDAWNSAITVFLIISLTCGIVWIPILSAMAEDNEQSLKWAIKCFKAHVCSVIIAGIIGFILPSSKTAAAMYVIPAIVNNEKIQTEAADLYDLAKDGLKQLVTQDKGEKK